MPALRSNILAAQFEGVITGRTPLLLRALPHHARKTLERHQRLTGVGPFLQFLDRDVIERLPAGSTAKQRARDVDHVRRARAFVNHRRAAGRAKAARGPARLVLIADNRGLALGDAKALAPAPDIGRVGRAMRPAARLRMIMPGPTCRHVDLERHRAAQALPPGDPRCRRRFCHCLSPMCLRGALAPKQTRLFAPARFWIASRSLSSGWLHADPLARNAGNLTQAQHKRGSGRRKATAPACDLSKFAWSSGADLTFATQCASPDRRLGLRVENVNP